MNVTKIRDDTGPWIAYHQLREDPKEKSVTEILLNPSTISNIGKELSRRTNKGKYCASSEMTGKIQNKLNFYHKTYRGRDPIPQPHYGVLDPGIADLFGVGDVKEEYHHVRTGPITNEEIARDVIALTIDDLEQEVEAIEQLDQYRTAFIQSNFNLLPQTGLPMYWHKDMETKPIPKINDATRMLQMPYNTRMENEEYPNNVDVFSERYY